MLNPCLTAAAAFVFSGSFAAAAAILTLISNPERLPQLEKLPRCRIPAFVIGQIALLMCIPHALVVAPAFLVPWVIPLALAVPWLGVFFVDYPFARAVGGIIILLAYETVHRSFDLTLPGHELIAVAGWIFGVFGIWLSGFPPLMRDIIRKTAASRRWRTAVAAAALTESGIFFYAAVMTLLTAVRR